MAAGIACGDDDNDPSPTPTPSPVREATATPTPTPSPSPTLSPSPTDGPQAFSAERAHAIVEHLSGEVGPRFAGGEGERLAAEYLRDELASYGYETEIQTFPIDTVEQLDTDLSVEAPGSPAFATVAMGGTAVGDAQGNLVVAGIGRAEEFPANAGDSIALIERGELTFAEKALNAQAAGAVGVIVYNNEDGPFIGRLDAAVSIPVVSMPREDGQRLADLVEQSGTPVSGRLVVGVDTSQGQSRNVIAEPAGGECRIVAGGHFDSVANGPGANDNGSGTAVVVEIARAMAADGQFDDVCFVLFGAEEIGLVGSDYYAQNLSAEERAGIIAMLNFDMLGVGDEWPIAGVGSVVELVADQAEALGLPYRLSEIPANVGSDHASFTARGIPSVMINCFCDPNYHTSQDVATFVQPERLKAAGDIGIGTIEALLAGG